MSFNLLNHKFAISSDHGGFALRKHLVHYFKANEITNFVELGAPTEEIVHYPTYVEELTKLILNKEVIWGIMICGTGLGTAIAANRYQGIHCTPCHDVTTARMARAHNDANILNLGGRVIGTFQAEEIIKAFASTDFIGDRYQLRKDMIDKMGCCS